MPRHVHGREAETFIGVEQRTWPELHRRKRYVGAQWPMNSGTDRRAGSKFVDLVVGFTDYRSRRSRRMVARQWLGDVPCSRLNARLNACSES